MKKIVLFAAMAALSACNQNTSEPTPAPTETATPAAVASAPTMADRAGTYSYDDGKGVAGTTVLTVDGNYTDTSADGKTVETGIWNVDDAGRVCFDPKGDDPQQPNRCYAIGEPAADGTMDATGEDGLVVKITKTA
jgi:hypothetical protein